MEYVQENDALERVVLKHLLQCDMNVDGMKTLAAGVEKALGAPPSAIWKSSDGAKAVLKECITKMVPKAIAQQAAAAESSDDDVAPARRAKKAGEGPPKDERIVRLTAIARQIGTMLPFPAMAKCDDDDEKVEVAEAHLKKNGLKDPLNATDREINAVKKRREEEKDMEGIDTTNIVSGGRRRQAPSAFWEGDGGAIAKSYGQLDYSEGAAPKKAKTSPPARPKASPKPKASKPKAVYNDSRSPKPKAPASASPRPAKSVVYNENSTKSVAASKGGGMINRRQMLIDDSDDDC